MNRRLFLRKALAGSLLLAATPLWTLLSSTPAKARPLYFTGGFYFLVRDELPTASNPVRLFVDNYYGRSVCWLTYTPNGEIKALHLYCPQENCTVRWHGIGYGFICPCCGTRFDLEGNVTRGAVAHGLNSFWAEWDSEESFVIRSLSMLRGRPVNKS